MSRQRGLHTLAQVDLANEMQATSPLKETQSEADPTRLGTERLRLVPWPSKWCAVLSDTLSLVSVESGQALVEFTLCLPLLLLIVFGVFTFGIAFSNYLVLEDATNVGARQLAISRGQSTDPCSTASTAIIAAAPTLTRASIGFTFLLNGTSYTGTSCSAATSNMVQGATARISVTYPCNLSSYKWSYAAGACTMTAATAELIQ